MTQTEIRVNRVRDNESQLYIYEGVKPVYKGHSREPENVAVKVYEQLPFKALYTG